jgi:hypothetical protein
METYPNNLLDPDSDNDGFNDGDELSVGSDPSDGIGLSGSESIEDNKDGEDQYVPPSSGRDGVSGSCFISSLADC